MLTKGDFEKLAQMRLDDALLLLEAGRNSSAYYLAGYAIELAIKACISKLIQPQVIPDKAFINAIYIHKLDNLLSSAGLLPQFNDDCKADTQLASCWGIVTKWNEQSRYEFWDSITATTLLKAVSDPDHGVFQWMKRHW